MTSLQPLLSSVNGSNTDDYERHHPPRTLVPHAPVRCYKCTFIVLCSCRSYMALVVSLSGDAASYSENVDTSFALNAVGNAFNTGDVQRG